jgi:hypothetical protein
MYLSLGDILVVTTALALVNTVLILALRRVSVLERETSRLRGELRKVRAI